MIKKRYCSECGVQVFGNSKYCCAEHRMQAYSKKHKAERAKAKAALKYEHVCSQCGETFKSRSPSAVVCKKLVCKNGNQRKKFQERYWSMSPEDRKALNRKKAAADGSRQDYKNNYQTVNAKCPGCGRIHKVTFETAYLDVVMPRKYCPRYPLCVHASDAAVMPASVWAGENMCRV